MSAELRLDKVPRRLGRYDVVGRLGTDSSSTSLVGRLDDPDGADGASSLRFQRRVVVIKPIERSLTEGKDLDELLAKLRKVASIDHDNLIQVWDVLQEGGEVSLVTEFVAGETIASLLHRLTVRGDMLSAGLAAHLVSQAAAGVQAAHERDVVHAHLTPHNILIGFNGCVKVLDIGVGSALGVLGDGAAIRPRDLPYASPERCKGDPLDKRSDVFSLGVVLWELLTGLSPFERASEADTIRAIISGEPSIPPSHVLSKLPIQLSEVMTRALSKEPSKRYATPRALRHELRTFMRGLSLAAPEQELTEQMRALFAPQIASATELVKRIETHAKSAASELVGAETPLAPRAAVSATSELEDTAIPPRVVPTSAPEPLAEAAPEPPMTVWGSPIETAAPNGASADVVDPPKVGAPHGGIVEVDTGDPAAEARDQAPLEPTRQGSSADDLPVVIPLSGSRNRTIIAAVAMVVFTGLAMFFLLRPSDASHPTSVEGSRGSASQPTSVLPVRQTASAVGVIAPPASGSAPSMTAEVTITIETFPPKATVLMGTSTMGLSPIELKVPRGKEAVLVEIRHPGYQTLTERIVPDVDQKLRLTLNFATTTRAPTPATSTSAASPYHRFD
jgi:serine/threonine-protein kinase